jgi:hypothetical protein
MQRLTRPRAVTVSAGRTKTAFSPVKGRMVVYVKAQALGTADAKSYDMNLLKTVYNSELVSQSIDANVDSCKQILHVNHSDIVTTLWISSEIQEASLGAILAAILLILQIIAITGAGIVLLNAAQSFIETLMPKPKYVAPDGTVFTDLASYITYMQNVSNPDAGYPYTCPYCGQGFKTKAEEQAHEATCPWKNGPPTNGGGGTDWIMLLIIGGVIIASIVIVPKVIDVFRPPSR